MCHERTFTADIFSLAYLALSRLRAWEGGRGSTQLPRIWEGRLWSCEGLLYGTARTPHHVRAVRRHHQRFWSELKHLHSCLVITALNSLYIVWLCQLVVSQLLVSASTSAHSQLWTLCCLSACGVTVTSLYYCTSAHSQLWILFVLSDYVSMWCCSYKSLLVLLLIHSFEFCLCCLVMLPCGVTVTTYKSLLVLALIHSFEFCLCCLVMSPCGVTVTTYKSLLVLVLIHRFELSLCCLVMSPCVTVTAYKSTSTSAHSQIWTQFVLSGYVSL